MLVLGRKQSERVIIDGRIVVTVVRVSGGHVRLGIEAPEDVAIRRAELCPPSADCDRGSAVTGPAAR
jgi:carbon storage regulator